MHIYKFPYMQICIGMYYVVDNYTECFDQDHSSCVAIKLMIIRFELSQ